MLASITPYGAHHKLSVPFTGGEGVFSSLLYVLQLFSLLFPASLEGSVFQHSGLTVKCFFCFPESSLLNLPKMPMMAKW